MEQQVFERVVAMLHRCRVETRLDVTFSKLTTLGCGGTIAVTAYPDTVRKLIKTIRLLTKLQVKYYLLGKGSNVLASDAHYDGVVIVTTKMSIISAHGVNFCAFAGTSTHKIYMETERRGLSGGEFLSCLPATIGGATVCNAGCYGQQMTDIVRSVTVLRDGRVRRLSAKRCQFGKRSSIFKNDSRYVVLAVRMKFTPSTAEAVRSESLEMRRRKADTQPLNFRSAGCALYHEGTSVSRLTDIAGLKGFTIGGAQVSTKHAGFILNVDKANSKDIYLTIQHVQRTLWERFGVQAKREICLVGFDEQNL